ncbi:MAG: glycosyltransferase family 2 protein [Flavobacteriales bacterium]|nr:glycosyltransferase family 2 protein [Flavobacteriales bacterium]
MSPRPELSIILVHYRTPVVTGHCLRSLFAHIGVEFEVIVVDNDPTDRSGKELASAFPRTRWLEAPGNIGFGAACNMGMRAATGRLLWLLNTDTEIRSDAGGAICHIFNERPEIDLLCHTLYNSDGSLQLNLFEDETPTPSVVRKQQWLQSPFGRWHLRRPKKISRYRTGAKVIACSGASLVLRRRVFEETGGFDTDFFMYCEETEWLRRRVRGKYTLWFEPSISVVHHSGGSGGAWGRWQNRLSYCLYLYKFDPDLLKLYLRYESINQCLWYMVRLAGLRIPKAREEWKHGRRLLELARNEITAYPPSFGARGANRLVYTA